jgi:CRP-like cAMP-binding protein
MSGSGFYVILDGEASVTLGGEELNRLRQGEFFGEISTLLDEPLTADVTAVTPMRVLEIPGPRLEAFLLSYPKVMLRMLVTEARRLQEVLAWRS